MSTINVVKTLLSGPGATMQPKELKTLTTAERPVSRM